jgi:hypothetical protein
MTPPASHYSDDSGFDWDRLEPPRGAGHEPAPRRAGSSTVRLAWTVVVLLTLCPALGFLLAWLLG